MSINLALILTLLTIFSGIVILLDRFVWRTRETVEGVEQEGGLHTLVEYSRSFFPVLLIVLVIRSFVFEPFRIPSGSMMPTLLQGDFIFVKKYSYGLRLPVLETKVLETGMPERGDVVVFRLPENPNINYIKRVIGLPGDLINYRNKKLTINDEPVDFEVIGRWSDGITVIEGIGGEQHTIQLSNRQNGPENEYRVPEGMYFMMGDNRDHSKDSRLIGPVPEANLVGEATLVWMHMDGLKWPRWDRIGTKIE